MVMPLGLLLVHEFEDGPDRGFRTESNRISLYIRVCHIHHMKEQYPLRTTTLAALLIHASRMKNNCASL
jgi:hypothetical protein